MSTAEFGLLKPGEQAEEDEPAADDRKDKTDSTKQKPPANCPTLLLIEINVVPLRRDPPARGKFAFWPQDSVQNEMIIKTCRYPLDQPQHQEPEANLGEQNGWNPIA